MRVRASLYFVAVVGFTFMLAHSTLGQSGTRSVDVTILQVDGEGAEGLIVWIANGQGEKPGLPVAVTDETGSAALALTPEQSGQEVTVRIGWDHPALDRDGEWDRLTRGVELYKSQWAPFEHRIFVPPGDEDVSLTVNLRPAVSGVGSMHTQDGPVPGGLVSGRSFNQLGRSGAEGVFRFIGAVPTGRDSVFFAIPPGSVYHAGVGIIRADSIVDGEATIGPVHIDAHDPNQQVLLETVATGIDEWADASTLPRPSPGVVLLARNHNRAYMLQSWLTWDEEEWSWITSDQPATLFNARDEQPGLQTLVEPGEYYVLPSSSGSSRGVEEFLLRVVGDGEDMWSSGVMTLDIPETGLPGPVTFDLPAVQQALLDALD
jgi:hypothetical protein